MALSKITDLSITDDTIKNADINSSAAIALTKLSGGINLAASGAGGVTGTLPVANGGTGITAQAIFQADLSSAQADIVDNTWTKVAFNNDVFDADSVFDTSNNRFIAPSDGKYVINYQVYSWPQVTNGSGCIARLYKNGSNFEHYASLALGGSTDEIAEISLTNTVILDLSTSDYIETYVKFNTGSSSAWTIDGATFMSGYKLGA